MRNFSCENLAVTAVLALAGLTSQALGQVANDECAGAIPLTSGTAIQFSTVTATPSPDPVPSEAQCVGTYLNWGTVNPDVWYSYTPTQSGSVEVTTCFAGGFDTSLVLYSGSCGALTQVACNGDSSADAACQQWYSKITGVGVTSGTTYYVRVGGYDAATGTAQVLLTFTPASAGCPATGGCGVVHATPGCQDAACCTQVCGANPLCCEVAWDETCVQGAVALCGIFVYNCGTPSATVPNDCATSATVFTGDGNFAITNATCNTDGPEHPGITCSSGNTVFLNDVWYRAKAVANGTLRVATCNNATFDTKVAVYNMGTNPAAFDYNTLNQTSVLVGCNDDGNEACQVDAVFASDLTVNVFSDNWYLVRVGTYDLPGSCTVFIDMPDPCALPAHTGVESEACGSSTNNGCNSPGGPTQSIAVGERIRGTIFTTTDAAGTLTRDVDFYSFTISQAMNARVTINANSFVSGYILTGDLTAANCTGVSIVAPTYGNCPSTVEACLNPGTYHIFVAPAPGTAIPCGNNGLNDYVVEITGSPASCPPSIDQVCANPGANQFSSSSAINFNGLIGCAFNPAFPNCATGGSTTNSYAKPMPAGAVGGAITCVDFGVFAVKRGVNTQNTACGFFISDRPLPATIGIYADINGGTPTRKIVTAGDGGDLQLIAERSVLVPGGAYLANLDFDPPLCLDGVTGNIVVIMDIPDLYAVGATPTIPDNSGYRLTAAGSSVAGQTSGTYGRLSCADAAGAYIPFDNFNCGTASAPAPCSAQWIVNLRGNFAGCTAPCPADLNGDGTIGSADLSILLSGWGTTSPDLNGDGTVGSADLSVLLSSWGACQ